MNKSFSQVKNKSSEHNRKYTFELSTGKHYLLKDDGSRIQINKLGKIPSKFRFKLTGIGSHKERKRQSEDDESVMYYVPSTTFQKQNFYYTPRPQKFSGYAQSPYLLSGRSSTEYFERIKKQSRKTLKKSGKSQISIKKLKGKIKLQKEMKLSDNYFQLSLNSISRSRPQPQNPKKSCYNYKCRKSKIFMMKNKQNMKKYGDDKTFGKSYFQKKLQKEKIQLKLCHDID